MLHQRPEYLHTCGCGCWAAVGLVSFPFVLCLTCAVCCGPCDVSCCALRPILRPMTRLRGSSLSTWRVCGSKASTQTLLSARGGRSSCSSSSGRQARQHLNSNNISSTRLPCLLALHQLVLRCLPRLQVGAYHDVAGGASAIIHMTLVLLCPCWP